jgi:hypothetical protein
MKATEGGVALSFAPCEASSPSIQKNVNPKKSSLSTGMLPVEIMLNLVSAMVRCVKLRCTSIVKQQVRERVMQEPRPGASHHALRYLCLKRQGMANQSTLPQSNWSSSAS